MNGQIGKSFLMLLIHKGSGRAGPVRAGPVRAGLYLAPTPAQIRVHAAA